MAKFFLSKKAAADLDLLHETNILNRGLGFAEQYYASIIAHLQMIAGNPYRYLEATQIKTGYRRSFFGDHAIWYKIISESEVDIIRINAR